jgi:hypothetical protein
MISPDPEASSLNKRFKLDINNRYSQISAQSINTQGIENQPSTSITLPSSLLGKRKELEISQAVSST